MIECVPDCKSRDQLGKLTRGSLNDYFHDKFGHGDSQDYQKVYKHYHNLYILMYIARSVLHTTYADKQITSLTIASNFHVYTCIL